MTDKKEWTDEETFELISLYEENQFLWNVKHKSYRNRDKKQGMFEEFATKFQNCDASEIQRKIHNLRNQVSHELKKIKKIKSGDGADGKYESKWKFFNALQFVAPAFITTASTSNMNIAQVNVESTQDEGGENIPTRNEATQEIRTNNTPTRSRKRPYENEDEEILKEALKIMKKPRDDYDRFGEYVALELKSLKSDYYRGRMKSEVRKIISNISDIDERHYWSSSTSSTPIHSPNPMECPLVMISQNVSPLGVDNYTIQTPPEQTQSTQHFYNSLHPININN